MKTRLSLLEQVSYGAEDAWAELNQIYRPLILRWLRRYEFQPDDAEDVTQEVMSFLSAEIDKFEHNGNVGAFRFWLRQVTVNRVKRFFRNKSKNPVAVGGSKVAEMIRALEDSKSEAAVAFDREHDLHILNRLLRIVATEFQEKTMNIFRQYVVEGDDVKTVCAKLDVNSKAVYTSKSRVLRRLRELAPDLINELDMR